MNAHHTWCAERSGSPAVAKRSLHAMLPILDREQGNGGAGKARQVVLTELREVLVGSPLQGVIEVIAGGCGEPCRHAWVGRVSQDVHLDLVASTSEPTVRATPVLRSPRVAEPVEHVSEHCRKA
jgi:hypothetical protein